MQNMRSSTAFSLMLHASVLVLILSWGFLRPYKPFEIDFDEVEVIDNAAFDALVAQSKAGNAGADQTDEANSTEAALEEPARALEAAPETTRETSVSEPPAEEVSPTEPAQSEPQPLPEVDQANVSGIAAADSQGQEQASEATNIPAPAARDAVELRQIAQAAQEINTPEPVEAAAEEAETTPEEEEPVEEAAPSETNATSEIRPEADEDAPISAAPSVAVVPTSRPSELRQPVEEVVQSEPTQETPTETPVETPATETTETELAETPSEASPEPINDTSNDEPSVDDLLAAVLEETGGGQSQGRGLSRFEIGAITQKITNNWNKSTIIDKDDYTRLVVVVRFQSDAAGNLAGPIELIEPVNADNDFLIAFEAAKRAIIASMPLEMPADIGAEGTNWTLKFDPASGTAGLY